MPRLTDLTGQNITTQATATYAENISAGENVKLNSSGELAKWGLGKFESSLTINEVKSSFVGTPSSYEITAYAKNQSVFFVAGGVAKVFAVERQSLTQAVSSVEFDLIPDIGSNSISGMCFLENENKLILVVNATNSIYSYNYSNGTLSLDQSTTWVGNTILAGREAPLLKNSNGNDVAAFGIVNNPAGAFLLSVGYVAGILTADYTAVNGSINAGRYAGGWDSINSKGLLSYLWNTGDELNCYSVTYSGVTPTFSSVATTTLNLDGNELDLAFDPVSSDFLILGADGASSGLRYTTVDISGVTPSVASASVLATTNTTRESDLRNSQLAYDLLSGNFFLGARNPGFTNSTKVLSLSGGILSLENEITLTTLITDTGARTNVFFDESYQSIVVFFRESSDDWQATIGRLDSSNDLVDFTPDQDNLIGVAIDTKTTGQSGKYRLLDKYKGVLVKNLSGLVPGAEYYINDVGGLTTSQTSDFYGLAISATQAITSTIVGLLTEIKKLTIGEGRTIAQFTGSDNTASGTYTTILDVAGSAVLKTITTDISNINANPVYRITINGNNETLGGGNANPFKPGNTGLNITETLMIPYNGGLKIELDSSSASYTAWSTIILHQD